MLALRLDVAPTLAESPGGDELFAAPPRLKLVPAEVETSAPTVEGSMSDVLRRVVVLTAARPTSSPTNAPDVAGTPAEALAPNIAPPPTDAPIPAEAPTPAEAPIPPEMPMPAEMPMPPETLAEAPTAKPAAALS